MHITHPDVNAYLEQFLPQRDDVLLRMEQEAEAEEIPIIGPYGAWFLSVIAKLHQAKRVLELGTAIGYSTIWLARAVEQRQGSVTTIELNQPSADRAQKNVEAAGLSDSVNFLVGDATEKIKTLEGEFDLVFLDVDKRFYQPLGELALPLLRSGGVLLTDNVLWGGRVAESNPDETTQLVQAFNQWTHQHPQLETIMVPLRDGIAISIKK